MNQFAKTFSLSACALAATLLISACGGGAAGDTVPPTATITSAASTVAGNTTFTFVFSESVGSSFSVEDLVVADGTPSNFTKVNATTYTVEVTPTSSAVPTLTLPTGKVFDLANNPNVVAFTVTPSVATCSTTALTCAPASSIPNGALTVYSDASTTAGFVPRPDWGQSVTQSEVTVAGNKSLLYTFQGGGFGAVGAYEGITWETSPLDVSGKTKLHLDLWTADLTSIKISLIGGGESAVTQALTPGTWNSIDIDLSQFPGATNKSAVIQLKLESAVAGALNVDNIYFWGAAAAACSTSTLTCAPTTTIPTGSAVIYSDASTTAGFVPRPDWGQSVTQSEVTVAGNKSLLYTFQGGGFGAVGAYEGITWETNPVDVSGKGKLHLDLWSADLTSLKISLIGGGESAVTQSVSPGSWNSVDIDLSQFTGATNKAAVIQLKLESAVAGSINVDNIYFWGTATAGGGTGGSGGSTTSALPITFDETNAPGLIDFGGTVSSIVTDLTSSTNKVARVTKAAGAEQWAGTTIAQLNVNPSAAANTGANAITTIPFTAARKTMTLRVYSPAAGIRVHLKVENASNDGINSEQNAMTTVANAWETLSFNFADATTMFIPNGATTYDATKPTSPFNLANTYNKASVFFDFGLGNGGYGAMPAERVYYFENLNLAP